MGNDVVDGFVKVHTTVPPTLVEEDPYTIAPVLEDTILDEEKVDSVAIQGLGMRGTAEVRQVELEDELAKWEDIQSKVLQAKDLNAQAMLDLTQWADTHASVEATFGEQRENLRSALQVRYQAKTALKDVVMDAERLDTAALQAALEDAEKQEVAIWDEELVTAGKQKKDFLEGFESLKDRLSRLEAEPLTDEESRGALSKLSTSVGQLQKELSKKKLPLPPEMLEKELLRQASDAIAASVGQAAEEQSEAP